MVPELKELPLHLWGWRQSMVNHGGNDSASNSGGRPWPGPWSMSIDKKFRGK